MSLQSARRLRRTMTEAESLLWSRLRDRRLDGLKFRRQVPLGPYVLDFFCEEHRLVVEVDGSQHADRVEHDEKRTEWPEAHQCRVLRFWNNDVMQRANSVLEAIRAAAGGAPHPVRLARHPLPQGEGSIDGV
ncbi:endonuclease domain-containing protein [Desertibaculum subflavum]|uniref:endonuclease domain-containing protein n=1 Tax=Desertibaculum subflavum TaxID=2268458 RepID=UPI000E6661C6